MIYIDCETTGLNPHKDRVALFQYIENDQPAQALYNPTLAQVQQILDRHDHIIGHNVCFDLGFLQYVPNQRLDDTLYLDRLVNFKEDGHSLDVVCKRVYGRDVYAHLDKKAMQRVKWGKQPPTPAELEYALLDVQVLPEVYATLSKGLTPAIQGVYNFDMKSIRAGLAIQQHGLPILQDDVEAEIETVEAQANRLVKLLHPLNPNSPKQVTKALGVDSSGDRILAELQSKGSKLAEQIREVRGLLKYLNFLKKLGADPRYYGTLTPAARSGRFTSSKENIQNLPRDTKRFIGSRENVIIAADFAQLELRTIAAITGDETMCNLFRDGADLHDYAAEKLFGPDFTKQQRQIAKVFNFSTLYGAGAATIGLILLTQTGITLPEHEVNDLKNVWKQTFQGIATWQRQGSTRHEMGLPHKTPHGRLYTSERYTDHLSIENQGAGAEVARIALHYILDNLPPEAKLINFIHDSYIVEAPNDPAIYQAAAKVMHQGMTYAWERAPFEKHGIPMPVDVGVAHDLKTADGIDKCFYVYSGE